MIKKLKAITLTETVVYISIFGMFMLVLIQFFLSVQINQDKIYKELELEMNQIFITNHFEERVGENFDFNEVDGSAIFFNSQESLEYKVLNNKLVLVKDLDTINLLNSKALVESFSLEPIWGEDDNALAVKISISLKHRGDESVTRDFSTLVKLVSHED